MRMPHSRQRRITSEVAIQSVHTGVHQGECCCCWWDWCVGCPPLGWALITVGALLVILAFLLGVTYFSIRTLTTSLEHVETVPAYAIALLVSVLYIIHELACQRIFLPFCIILQ